jgi:isocitrate dehydrogenase
VQQFLQENYLRWDSLGEFLALAVSIEDLGLKSGNAKALALARALDQANGRILEHDKSPHRKVGELDTRGSHFYLAMYWARALADQTEVPELQAIFTPVAERLEREESAILAELNGVQGRSVAIGGYYHPDPGLVGRAMRPSATLNGIIEGLAGEGGRK